MNSRDYPWEFCISWPSQSYTYLFIMSLNQFRFPNKMWADSIHSPIDACDRPQSQDRYFLKNFQFFVSLRERLDTITRKLGTLRMEFFGLWRAWSRLIAMYQHCYIIDYSLSDSQLNLEEYCGNSHCNRHKYRERESTTYIYLWKV